MNIGEIIAQKGIVVRGRTIIDSPKVLSSIIKTKLANARREVVRTTQVAKAQSAKPVVERITPKAESIFKDEMQRLGVVKDRQDKRIHLGTKHMRKKNHITTHAGVNLEKFTFAEAMVVSKEPELRKLGRVRGNFDEMERRASNNTRNIKR